MRALDGKDREGNNPPGKAYLKEHQSPPANIYLHEADLWIERCRKGKWNMKYGECVRYADREYAAEQPQGLPAVIAELTRWDGPPKTNLELTWK